MIEASALLLVAFAARAASAAPLRSSAFALIFASALAFA